VFVGAWHRLHIKTFPDFVDSGDSSPCSQMLPQVPYPELDECTPHSRAVFCDSLILTGNQGMKGGEWCVVGIH
jgi:hypothetical protein